MAKSRSSPTQNLPGQLSLGFEAQDLIEVPAKPDARPGQFDFDQRVRASLNKAIKASVFSRDEIAGQLTELVGRPISKAALDTYTGSGRPNRLPADLLPALTTILGPELLNDLAEPAGCRVLVREDVAMARLGQTYLLSLHVKEEMSRLVADTPLFQGLTNER